MSHEMMDEAETADFLQMSGRSVVRRTADGTLPGSRRIGQCVRWSRSILRAWIIFGCPEDAEGFEVRCQQWIPEVLTAGDTRRLPEDRS